jgi:toxin ParE1/3/4
MRVRFSNHAREDLLEIEAYLFDHADEAIADRAMKRILARCRQLEERPMLGRARPDIWSDARSLLATPWLIVYRLTEGGVEISRIVHQSRDLGAL